MPFVSRHILISFLFMLINTYSVLLAQDSIRVFDLGEEIVVTASRYPTAFKNVARSVTLMNEQTITQLPVNSLQEILQYIPSVDLRQRGPAGVQADISIRGSSFEQTLILIDGFRVSDPQTGHHNLNIPSMLQNIEKVEVLRGPGSRFYGPNALGGVINFITGDSRQKAIQIQAMGGEYGLYRTGASLQIPSGNFSHRFSFEKAGSGSYRPSTDFSTWSGDYSTQIKSGNHRGLVSFSHIDKEFGAGLFYSDKFPDQWEHTRTTLFRSQYKYQAKHFHFTPRIFWRRNDDHYVLIRSNPPIYQNNHVTDVAGLELQGEYISSWGISGMGMEASREQITGNESNGVNLGNRHRDKTGLFFEQQITGISKLNIILGISAFHYSDWGWQSWPGIDINYRLSSALSIYGSVNQAFRVPSFTEMYYSSPTDIGNPLLQPEESIEYETGLSYQNALWHITTSVFLRESENLIDWIRRDDQNPWQAANISNLDMSGFEFSSRYLIPDQFLSGFFDNIQIAYTHLSARQIISEYQSKYVQNYLIHQIIASTSHSMLIQNLNSHWQVRYEDRINGDDYWLTDLKISYQLDPFLAYIEATNLFNTNYESVTSIPMPGRWIKIGIHYKLTFDI